MKTRTKAALGLVAVVVFPGSLVQYLGYRMGFRAATRKHGKAEHLNK